MFLLFGLLLESAAAQITDVYKPEGLIPAQYQLHQTITMFLLSNKCVNLVLCPLVCNVSAAITLISFSVHPSL